MFNEREQPWLRGRPVGVDVEAHVNDLLILILVQTKYMLSRHIETF